MLALSQSEQRTSSESANQPRGQARNQPIRAQYSIRVTQSEQSRSLKSPATVQSPNLESDNQGSVETRSQPIRASTGQHSANQRKLHARGLLIRTKYCFLLLLSGQACRIFATPWTLQRARLPCPSLSPGICSNSCPLSKCCHLIGSSTSTSVSLCFQCLPASGPFPQSWLLASGGLTLEFPPRHQSFQCRFRADFLQD